MIEVFLQKTKIHSSGPIKEMYLEKVAHVMVERHYRYLESMFRNRTVGCDSIILQISSENSGPAQKYVSRNIVQKSCFNVTNVSCSIYCGENQGFWRQAGDLWGSGWRTRARIFLVPGQRFFDTKSCNGLDNVSELLMPHQGGIWGGLVSVDIFHFDIYVYIYIYI